MSSHHLCLLLQTIAPTVPLSKDLEALYDVLLHQKPTATHSTSGRELRGMSRICTTCVCACAYHSIAGSAVSRVKELMQLSPKELDAKIRELENWNFRLNLDECACSLLRQSERLCGSDLLELDHPNPLLIANALTVDAHTRSCDHHQRRS